MTAPQDDVTTDPQSIIAELRAERDAALAREAALGEGLLRAPPNFQDARSNSANG